MVQDYGGRGRRGVLRERSNVIQDYVIPKNVFSRMQLLMSGSKLVCSLLTRLHTYMVNAQVGFLKTCMYLRECCRQLAQGDINMPFIIGYTVAMRRSSSIHTPCASYLVNEEQRMNSLPR